MTINKKLRVQNVVVLANNFNPSIFGQSWLVKNKFFEDTDFLVESFFSADAVNAKTKKADLLVIPPQIQIAPVPVENWEAVINDILIPLIRRLPEVPYKAAGINFNWFVSAENINTSTLSKELFYSDTLKLFSEFKDPGSKFGIYLSKDFHGCRLKLDVKPIIAVMPNTPPEDVIQFAFNFHKDFTNEITIHQDLITFLQDAKSMMQESTRLIGLI